MRLLLNWVLSALAVWIVSKIVPGISVSGPVAALIAALVIGFINATVGVLLKDSHFSPDLDHLGTFLVRDQRLDAEICVGSCFGLSGAYLHGRVSRRHPAERGKRAAEVARLSHARPSLGSVMCGETIVVREHSEARSTTKQEGGAGLPGCVNTPRTARASAPEGFTRSTERPLFRICMIFASPPRPCFLLLRSSDGQRHFFLMSER